LGCHHDLPLDATKARWVRAGKAGSDKCPVGGGLGESVYLQLRPLRLPFYLPSVCLGYKKAVHTSATFGDAVLVFWPSSSLAFFRWQASHPKKGISTIKRTVVDVSANGCGDHEAWLYDPLVHVAYSMIRGQCTCDALFQHIRNKSQQTYDTLTWYPAILGNSDTWPSRKLRWCVQR